MNLADHLLPLLRDHDCVIIPDFGGLVAEYAPARVQPGGRHVLHPPTRHVAFNQALTRNDGLLVDALRQHLGLSTDAAREAVRQAVAHLRHDLHTAQRTELPGIGTFRQQAGRGLQFDYTGTAHLLPAAYGLPDLTAYPVRVTDVRLAREQQAELVPRLRAAGRNLRLRRVLPGAAVGLLAGLAVAGLYLANLHPALVPVAWRGYVPRWQQEVPATQQATLATAPVSTVRTIPPSAAATITPPAEATGWSNADVPAVAGATLAASPAAASPTATHKPVPVVSASAAHVAAPVTPVVVKSLAAPAVAHRAAAAPKVAGRAARPLASAARWAKPAGPAHLLATGKAAAPVASHAMKAQAGRYYVVVGSFQSLAGARQVQDHLLHVGRPSRLLLPDYTTRMYRVTAADFSSRPAAYAALPRLRYLAQGSYVYPLR